MTLEFSLTIVSEGACKLIVPADFSSSGPSMARMPVFYNPSMEFSRDFSVALLSNILKDGDSFLDGLAAAGCRGIRIARESGKKVQLHLNDLNERAVELIRKNLELNGVSDAIITSADLGQLLLSTKHNCVDIDPFGSPVPFFPMAAGAVRNGGILCVTATDTGTISGIFSSACLRKYGCKAFRVPFAHEIGVRNLIGFIARESAKLDIGISPIASLCADHYIRTFVRIRKGALEADRAIRKLGYCYFDSERLERWYSPYADGKCLGPIWIDRTCDPEVLANLEIPRGLRNVDRIASFLKLLVAESRLNRPFFDVDEFARKLKRNPIPMTRLIPSLSESGFATRTHYGPKTFSTSRSIEEIEEIFIRG